MKAMIVALAAMFSAVAFGHGHQSVVVGAGSGDLSIAYTHDFGKNGVVGVDLAQEGTKVVKSHGEITKEESDSYSINLLIGMRSKGGGANGVSFGAIIGRLVTEENTKCTRYNTSTDHLCDRRYADETKTKEEAKVNVGGFVNFRRNRFQIGLRYAENPQITIGYRF